MNDTDMSNTTNDSDQDMAGVSSLQSAQGTASNTSASAMYGNISKSWKPKKHNPTGYTWTREEDAPTYGWRNKKAQEEYARAAEQIIDIDKMIGKQYGDIALKRAAAKSGQ